MEEREGESVLDELNPDPVTTSVLVKYGSKFLSTTTLFCPHLKVFPVYFEFGLTGFEDCFLLFVDNKTLAVNPNSGLAGVLDYLRAALKEAGMYCRTFYSVDCCGYIPLESNKIFFEFVRDIREGPFRTV